MTEKLQKLLQNLEINYAAAIPSLVKLTDIGVTRADEIDPTTVGCDPKAKVYSIVMGGHQVYSRFENKHHGLGWGHVLTVEHSVVHFIGEVHPFILTSVAERVKEVTPFSVGLSPFNDLTLYAAANIDPHAAVARFEEILSTDLHLLSVSIQPASEVIKEWAAEFGGDR